MYFDKMLSHWPPAAGRCISAQHAVAPFRTLALTLALLLPYQVTAADLDCAQPIDSGEAAALDELEEVVVLGEKAKTKTKDLRAWLSLLVGKFSYEGHVDLCGDGGIKTQRPVTGSADCIGSGSSPNVHCTVNVSWAPALDRHGVPLLGGASTMLPAFVIYSLENRYIPEEGHSRLGPMFAQVDNKGIAEWGFGQLVGDTFTSKEPCVGMPGICYKTTKISARPGSNPISMLIEFTIDNRRVLRHAFVLHRKSSTRHSQSSTGSSP